MFKREKFPIISKASLSEIEKSHSLRCDSKQFEKRFRDMDEAIKDKECCYLGKFLPTPLIKGAQPSYLEEGKGVPVINTLCIQKMKINLDSCKHISVEDFILLNQSRKLKKGDVLLTVDGGTSIGKPVLFNLEGDFTIDSHVVILRPDGLSPKALVYLLASPLGQLYFQRYESGASGQTSVTEEDLRRFKISTAAISKLEKEVEKLEKERLRIEASHAQLVADEEKMWESFTSKVLL